MKKDVWAYCRVSTPEQAYGDDEALANQINRCRLHGASKVYFDIDKRTKDIRPGLKQLLEDVAKLNYGEISELVFTRLDRLAASAVTFYTLLKALKEKGIKPVAIDDSLDLESVGGELSTDIRLAVSKHEINMLGLRIRKSLEYRRQQGIIHNSMAFGYVLIDNEYCFDYTPALCHLGDRAEYSVFDIVTKIFDTFELTHSIRGTSHHITEYFGLYHGIERNNQKKKYVIENKEEIKLPAKRNIGKRFPHCTLRFSSAAISYMLKNNVYSGKKGLHDKLYITEEKQQGIIETIKRNKCNPKSDRTRNDNEYSGKIRCGLCDGTITRTFGGRQKPYYFCRNAKVDGHCINKKYIAKSNLDAQVLALFRSYALDLAKKTMLFEETIPIESSEIVKLKSQIKALEQIFPSSPEILGAIQSLKNKLDGEMVKNLNFSSTHEENIKDFIDLFQSLNAFAWENVTISDRRRLFDLYVSCIYLTEKIITISWNV